MHFYIIPVLHFSKTKAFNLFFKSSLFIHVKCWNVKMKNSNLNILTWFILSINIAHSFFGFQVSFSDFPSKIWLQFLYYQNNSWLDSCLQSRTEVSEIFANNQTRKSTSESSLNKMELLQSQAPTKRELLGSLVVRTYWSLEIGRLI